MPNVLHDDIYIYSLYWVSSSKSGNKRCPCLIVPVYTSPLLDNQLLTHLRMSLQADCFPYISLSFHWPPMCVRRSRLYKIKKYSISIAKPDVCCMVIMFHFQDNRNIFLRCIIYCIYGCVHDVRMWYGSGSEWSVAVKRRRRGNVTNW